MLKNEGYYLRKIIKNECQSLIGEFFDSRFYELPPKRLIYIKYFFISFFMAILIGDYVNLVNETP